MCSDIDTDRSLVFEPLRSGWYGRLLYAVTVPIASILGGISLGGVLGLALYHLADVGETVAGIAASFAVPTFIALIWVQYHKDVCGIISGSVTVGRAELVHESGNKQNRASYQQLSSIWFKDTLSDEHQKLIIYLEDGRKLRWHARDWPVRPMHHALAARAGPELAARFVQTIAQGGEVKFRERRFHELGQTIGFCFAVSIVAFSSVALIAQWGKQGEVSWRIMYFGIWAASITWTWQKLRRLFGSGVILTSDNMRRSQDSRRAAISWTSIKSLNRDSHGITLHESNGEQLVRIPCSVENFFALEDLLEELAPHLFEKIENCSDPQDPQ